MSFQKILNFRNRYDYNKTNINQTQQSNTFKDSFYNKNNYINTIPQNYKSNNTYNNIPNYNEEEEQKNDFENNYDNDYENEQNHFRKQYNLSNNVIGDFQKIMEQTKNIRNKILLKSKDMENNIFNKSYFYNNSTHDSNITKNKNNKKKKNNFEEELDSYLIEDYYDKNNQVNTNNTNLTLDSYINRNETFEEKLRKKNQKLSNINSKIDTENNLLESEILVYRGKANRKEINSMEQQNNNISNDIFYQSLKKFINNIKASMKNNIELNKNLCENLLDELNKIKIIQQNHFNKENTYNNLINKFQKQKQRISDIQKYNFENNKRYLSLKDEQKMLNKMFEKLKMDLLNLKTREKSLNLKKDINIKNNKDNKELILALEKTIKNLNNANSSNNVRNSNKNNKLIRNKNTLNLYDNKLKQLYSILSNIQNEKNMICEENMRMKNNIEKNLDYGLVGENKKLVKENELKVELNEIKLNKYNIEKQIGEKNELIKKMKNIINDFTNDVNNDETEYKELKKQIAILMREKLNENKNEYRLNENKLKKEINENLDLNNKLNEEINSSMKYYDDIIINKDRKILELENKIKKNENKLNINTNYEINKEKQINYEINENLKNEDLEGEENYIDFIDNQGYGESIKEQEEEYFVNDSDVEGNNNENYEGEEKEENFEELIKQHYSEQEDYENNIEDKE